MWSLEGSMVMANADWPWQVNSKREVPVSWSPTMDSVKMCAHPWGGSGSWAYGSTDKFPSIVCLDLELFGPLAVCLGGHRTQ